MTPEVLTTGQVAEICHVAPKTVGSWVDNGHLRGYRMPGDLRRRILVTSLRKFMLANGMPSEWLDAYLAGTTTTEGSR